MDSGTQPLQRETVQRGIVFWSGDHSPVGIAGIAPRAVAADMQTLGGGGNCLSRMARQAHRGWGCKGGGHWLLSNGSGRELIGPKRRHQNFCFSFSSAFWFRCCRKVVKNPSPFTIYPHNSNAQEKQPIGPDPRLLNQMYRSAWPNSPYLRPENCWQTFHSFAGMNRFELSC